MLAGENATDLDAEFQDFRAEFFSLLQFTGCIGVIENEWMQIAVTGMENIGEAQAVFYRRFFHAFEYERQFCARDGPVRAVVVGRNAPDRREGRLAAGPKQ